MYGTKVPHVLALVPVTNKTIPKPVPGILAHIVNHPSTRHYKNVEFQGRIPNFAQVY